MFLKLLNLITRGGTPQNLGSYALCQGLTVFFLIYPWLRREILTATGMSSRTWGIGPYRVITRRYVLSFKSRVLEDNSANAEFKVLLEKSKKQTIRELSRKNT